MVKDWPLVSSQAIADLGLFRLTKDRAQNPRTERERDFFVLHMPDWLLVVPITTDGQVVLVNQYRHGSRMSGLEVPGGLLDPEDPDPSTAALRELREETGYGGGEIKDLGSFWPQPALMSNRVHVFASLWVEPQDLQDQDEGEDLEVVLADKDEVWAMAHDGRIHNAMSVMALNLAKGAGLL